ncbi:MAG: DMT family transporter [Gammaproteobacteria bacterium]|nr:DMT family transporter [Gammaproteobacteria bacterium]
MQIPWYIPAIGAAIVWGIHYPLLDFAMKRISIYGVLLLSVIPMFLLIPLFLRELAADIDQFKLLPVKEQWIISAIMLTTTAGAVLIYLSIHNKNATLASLIEISYPLFVVFFGYVLFKQVHVNLSVVLGGLMILIGASLIIYNNQ